MITKVAVIIVTFNRLELLKYGINALRTQTRPPDKIIIVDNGSTDGTRDWLSSQEDLLVFNQGNSGSAGGFSRGIKEAYDLGFDWIWVLDDDGYPSPECLAKLLEKVEILPSRQYILASAIHDTVNKDILGFYLPKVNQRNSIYFLWYFFGFLFKTTNIKSELLGTYKRDEIGYSYLSNPFNSILISKEVVAKCGVPDSKYFISGDEIEYMLRVIKAGIKVYYVEDSISYNPAMIRKPIMWKEKYGQRNLLNVAIKHLPFYLSFLYIVKTFSTHIIHGRFYLIKPCLAGCIGKFENTYHLKPKK